MRTCGSVIVALDVGDWMLVSHDFVEWRNSAGCHGRDDGRSTSENKEADRSRVRGRGKGNGPPGRHVVHAGRRRGRSARFKSRLDQPAHQLNRGLANLA